ncbi:hypothetical protein EJB05_23795, partial [Eragrostis curvula]
MADTAVWIPAGFLRHASGRLHRRRGSRTTRAAACLEHERGEISQPAPPARARHSNLPMGDVVLYAFLQVLFQAISDFVKKELQLERRIEKERERLILNVDMIQAILRGAEKKTQLSDLKDASYYGIEALDEYFYEVQRCQVIPFADTRDKCSALSLLRRKFRHDMEKMIMDFTRRIDCIKDIKEMYLAFQVETGQHYDGSDLNPSTLLPPTVVCGRQNDCDNIVDMLLQPYLKPNVAVLPIVGDAYIGKTTLAQLVLNDERVSVHFELKLWVHVSHKFNIERITSSIIESIEGFPFHCDNLNTLQMHMEKRLRGRRYLLVLDDYWNETGGLGEAYTGGRGSKIIVTTRSETVARIVRIDGTLVAPYKLQRLQEEDCWSLFCQCALGTESYPHNYGDIQDRRLKEEVLQKCKGVPFIAASLGYNINLLHENDRSKWADILLKEKWDSSTTHFNKALRLSYAQLDYHLKPCFAYSSLIPQKFQFEKKWLIQHWMAQGFIVPNPDTGKTMGMWEALTSRANIDHTGQQHSYSLSETMYGLASHVSGADCKCYMMGEPYNLPEKVQHLTVVFNKFAGQDLFKLIPCGKFLHTFIVLGGSTDSVLRIPYDIGERFTRLCTLDLSNFGLTDLPKSIGKLKHLRCLQLQGTKIKCLPKSICDLYHLQTLGLRNCYDLEELPHELKNLCKLRHIDLVMTRDPDHKVISLRCMPKDIGLLTDLQILSRFIVSKRSPIHPHRASIGELADLNNLHGELLISNLHLIKDVQEAEHARLASKQFLQELELSWSKDNNGKVEQTSEHLKTPTIIELASKKIVRKLDFSSSSENNGQSEQILEHLKAPITIKKLTLTDYKNLVTVSLYDFERCSVLPTLGLLPHLENLHLKGWDRLISMNCCGFYGSSFEDDGLHKCSFQSLKKLHLENMGRLKQWEGDKRCVFPSLVELVIENCCVMEQVTHRLPSLTKIAVEGSPAFLGLPNFPSLKCVDVKASGEWIWESWRSLSSSISITLCKLPTVHFPLGLGQFRSLQRLEISHFEKLESMPDDWPPYNPSHFSVRHCPRLRKLPMGIQRLQALEDMEIIDCGMLNHLPEINGLISLIRLPAGDCRLWFNSVPSTCRVS